MCANPSASRYGANSGILVCERVKATDRINWKSRRNDKNMTTNKTDTYVQHVIDEVSTWNQITADDGRFKSDAFRLGSSSREIGHIHQWGAVDIGFPRPIRDQLLAEGKTGPHHVLPNSGATTLHIKTEADIERALWVLRFSYLYQVNRLQHTLDDRNDPKLAEIDVEAGLQDLGVSDDLRIAIEKTI